MKSNRRSAPSASRRRDPDRVERRHPRSIRFTTAEWAEIRRAAARHGLRPSEIVRARALGLPDTFHADASASFSPGHIPHPPDRATRKPPGRNPAEKRLSRGVRLSDSEWALIKHTAARQGLGAGELVRWAVLALLDGQLHEHPAGSVSAGHVALIEASYRAVHLLATLATQSMPYEEVDTLLGTAHQALLATLDEEPVGVAPCESLSAGRRQRHAKKDASPYSWSGLIARFRR